MLDEFQKRIGMNYILQLFEVNLFNLFFVQCIKKYLYICALGLMFYSSVILKNAAKYYFNKFSIYRFNNPLIFTTYDLYIH
jgi:hypothetical protein